MRSLQMKLRLSIAIPVLLSIVILAASQLYLFYQHSMSEMIENVTSNAQAYKHTVESKMYSFKNQLEMMAQVDTITDSALSIEKRVAVLDEKVKATGYNYISVADEKGDTYRNSNILEREYFTQAMSGTTYISSPVVSKVDGKLTILAGTVIKNSTAYKGIAYGGISYETFSQLISNIKLGEGGYGFIVDKTGTVIAHPDAAIVQNLTNYIELGKTDKSFAELGGVITKMTAGESGNGYYTKDGVNRFVAYVPIEGPEGWSLAVTLPVNQALASLYLTLLISGIIGVVLLVIALIFSSTISRNISRPIIKSIKRIEQLAEGDLATEVVLVSGKDEIARLSEALRDTVTELRAYITDISRMLTSMADSDFTVSSTGNYQGDFLPIKDALQRILQSLTRTFMEISQSADQVHDGSTQVSAGAQNLSQNSTEQAATIETLSNSVSAISQQVQNNANNAMTALKLSKESGAEVSRGNTQMNEMLHSMGDINASSNEIAKIIKVIDDIAFQTNILALNAAVEAARAGAAGKGFAVVADEVRNLAAKSAEAAKTTTDLIAQSITSVKRGTEIADETASSLSSIVEKVTRVNTLMDDIATASSEQAQAILQVNDGMAQISAVIQTNSATAEESAAASEELTGQAELLKDLMASFKLDK